jgi:hypothetical protein
MQSYTMSQQSEKQRKCLFVRNLRHRIQLEVRPRPGHRLRCDIRAVLLCELAASNNTIVSVHSKSVTIESTHLA